MIHHFISVITFDHKIYKKVINVYKYFSLKHANYALIFVVTFSLLFERPAALAFQTIFPRNLNLAYAMKIMQVRCFCFRFRLHLNLKFGISQSHFQSNQKECLNFGNQICNSYIFGASSFLLFVLQSHWPKLGKFTKYVLMYILKNQDKNLLTYVLKYVITNVSSFVGF